MAGPIYKFFQFRFTESWYKLSKSDQDAHQAKVKEALKSVDGKTVLMCTPVWTTEKWLVCGVEEFPNAEAVQNYAMQLYQLGHFRYIEATSMLAMNLPPM
jgi:hypothetical protein